MPKMPKRGETLVEILLGVKPLRWWLKAIMVNDPPEDLVQFQSQDERPHASSREFLEILLENIQDMLRYHLTIESQRQSEIDFDRRVAEELQEDVFEGAEESEAPRRRRRKKKIRV